MLDPKVLLLLATGTLLLLNGLIDRVGRVSVTHPGDSSEDRTSDS